MRQLGVFRWRRVACHRLFFANPPRLNRTPDRPANLVAGWLQLAVTSAFGPPARECAGITAPDGKRMQHSQFRSSPPRERFIALPAGS